MNKFHIKRPKKHPSLKEETLGDRIERRLAKLLKKPTTASVDAGLAPDFIRNIFRAEAEGRRHHPRSDKIQDLAFVLFTNVDWLTSGKGLEEQTAPPDTHIESDDIAFLPTNDTDGVPIKGYVRAGSEAFYLPMEGGELDWAPAPPNKTENTIALEIRGESLGELFDRWVVYYDDIRKPVTPDLIGRLCVVGIDDGRVVVKKIKRAEDGYFDLISANDEPIRGVRIDWAARVTFMGPR